MGHLLHYIIPFQNLFQMLFVSFSLITADYKLLQRSLNKMLLFFMDIVGIYRPM